MNQKNDATNDGEQSETVPKEPLSVPKGESSPPSPGPPATTTSSGKPPDAVSTASFAPSMTSPTMRPSRSINSEVKLLGPTFTKGRVFLPAHPTIDLEPLRSGFSTLRVLSYNVLAQCNIFEAISYCLPIAAVWERRRVAMIEELLNYQADIVCLQDVDKYIEWWQPELSQIGYDSVYKRRTSTLRKNHEGVLVAWRQEELQALRVEHVSLNDAILEEPEVRLLKALADDVASFVLLQPRRGLLPSAICVANTQFHTSDATPTPHLIQARYLAKRIQRFNADFQAPVILCGSLNAPAGSLVYEALCTGKRVGGGGVPRGPSRPVVESLSRSSVMVKWPAVPSTTDSKGRDIPILGYWVAYQPGGNTNIGFAVKRFAPDEECLETFYPYYKPSGPDPFKNVRMHVVAELSSNVAYEFRVAAENANGIGPWSLPSQLIETRHVDYGSSCMRYMLGVEELEDKRRSEQKKQEERAAALLAKTQESLAETTSKGPVHAYLTDTGAEHTHEDGSRNRAVAPARKHMVQYFATPQTNDPLVAQPAEAKPARSEGKEEVMGGRPFQVVERGDAYTENEGCRDDFHENSLRLCSAYATYCASGEPPYTTLSERYKGTTDYILHSAEALLPFRLLSLPSLDDLDGMSVGQHLLAADDTIATPAYWAKEYPPLKTTQQLPTSPTSQQQQAANSVDVKRWAPSAKLDMNSSMYLIPNRDFPSDHLPIMAEFGMVRNYTGSQWRSFYPSLRHDEAKKK